MKQAAVTRKPALATDAALKFAAQEGVQPAAVNQTGVSEVRGARAAPPAAVSGLVPEGDVRLTANIRQDLHLKLKLKAAHERNTIGEIIESLVERHL